MNYTLGVLTCQIKPIIMNKLTTLIPFLGMSILVSCGPQERVSKDVFDDVNKNMEIKRISEVDILDKAMEWGDSITMEAQAQLIQNLQEAISNQGVYGAIDFCSVNALAILEKESEIHNVKIRRVSNRYRNPSDQPQDSEIQILEAYEYNAENGIESEPNIQKLENGEVLLYTKPIIISSSLCLNCHGKPGLEIDEATLKAIDSKYPNDRAKDHNLKDLRGMWSVMIPKKEVVKKM